MLPHERVSVFSHCLLGQRLKAGRSGLRSPREWVHPRRRASSYAIARILNASSGYATLLPVVKLETALPAGRVNAATLLLMALIGSGFSLNGSRGPRLNHGERGSDAATRPGVVKKGSN